MANKAKAAISNYGSYGPESKKPKRDEYVTAEDEDEEDEYEDDEGTDEPADVQGLSKEGSGSDKAGRVAWAIAQGMAHYGNEMKKYHAKRESWRRRFSKG